MVSSIIYKQCGFLKISHQDLKIKQKDLGSFDWTLRQGSGLRLNQAGFLCLDYNNNGDSGGNYKKKVHKGTLFYCRYLRHKLTIDDLFLRSRMGSEAAPSYISA
jgi:hypothetical protein